MGWTVVVKRVPVSLGFGFYTFTLLIYGYVFLIGQFRYFKIQLYAIHLSTRLRGINPTNALFYSRSLVLRSIVYS